MKLLLLIIYLWKFSESESFLLDPYDQAIGNWNVSLRRRDHILLESMIFPATDHLQDDGCDNGQGTMFSLPRRNVKCKLSLKPDGTFELAPHLDIKSESTAAHNGRCISSSRSKKSLRGQWQLRPNPYCVTDRRYDELTLISNPKIYKKSSPKIDQRIHHDVEYNCHGDDGGRIRIEMHCKIWGRYSSNSIRKLLKYKTGREAARLTHGKLSIVMTGKNEYTSENANTGSKMIRDGIKRRVLCSTFNAKPCSDAVEEGNEFLFDESDEDDPFDT